MGRAPRRADFSHPRPDFTAAGSFPQIVNFMNFGARAGAPSPAAIAEGRGARGHRQNVAERLRTAPEYRRFTRPS